MRNLLKVSNKNTRTTQVGNTIQYEPNNTTTADIYVIKVNSGNIRAMCETCTIWRAKHKNVVIDVMYFFPRIYNVDSLTKVISAYIYIFVNFANVGNI